jgi:hypothetical protein
MDPNLPHYNPVERPLDELELREWSQICIGLASQDPELCRVLRSSLKGDAADIYELGSMAVMDNRLMREYNLNNDDLRLVYWLSYEGLGDQMAGSSE